MLLRFAHFELDERRFELRRDGARVPIQPKVLDLILHLARHRERLVTKDELYTDVWRGVLVTEASLSQAVSLARRALDDSASAQSVIRTVHGKGFRFVADAETLAPDVGAVRIELEAETHTGDPSLELETEEVSSRSPGLGTLPHLFAAVHCDEPALGSARYCLAELDEVSIGRGDDRQAQRENAAITRLLELSLPGPAVSRNHASLVRTREGWFVVDRGAKNGTFVNGHRVTRQALRHRDVVECGRCLLLFEEHETPSGLTPDFDARHLPADPYSSLLPALQFKQHLFRRIAQAESPILLLGEPGVGKAACARSFHEHSERPGKLVLVDAGVTPELGAAELWGDAGQPGVLEQAEGGTLYLTRIDRLSRAAQARLAHAVRSGFGPPRQGRRPAQVRLIASSTTALDDLARRGEFDAELLARLSAFRLTLPPLATRRVDLGTALGSWQRAHGRSLTLSPEVGLGLLRYPWPHNWLELERCLADAVTLAPDGRIRVEHLPGAVAAAASA